MSLNIKINITDQITPDLEKKIRQLQPVPKDTFQFFRAHTPIRTGNARARTRFIDNEIQANYAYAEKLDQGASRQAPDGMTKPTSAYFTKRINAILGK